jgi:hypothetical protein
MKFHKNPFSGILPDTCQQTDRVGNSIGRFSRLTQVRLRILTVMDDVMSPLYGKRYKYTHLFT